MPWEVLTMEPTNGPVADMRKKSLHGDVQSELLDAIDQLQRRVSALRVARLRQRARARRDV